MSAKIENDGATLKITDLQGTVFSKNKEKIELKVSANNLIISEDSRDVFSFLYTDVSTPTSTSAEDLRSKVESYLDNNNEFTAFSSTPRSSTPTPTDIQSGNGKGLIAVFDVTAIPVGGATVTLTIQGKDSVSGKYYDILSSIAISTISTTVLKIYPGIIAATNLYANDIIPKTVRIKVTHSGATSFTYSIGVTVLD